jgi:hypothetical protein
MRHFKGSFGLSGYKAILATISGPMMCSLIWNSLPTAFSYTIIRRALPDVQSRERFNTVANCHDLRSNGMVRPIHRPEVLGLRHPQAHFLEAAAHFPAAFLPVFITTDGGLDDGCGLHESSTLVKSPVTMQGRSLVLLTVTKSTDVAVSYPSIQSVVVTQVCNADHSWLEPWDNPSMSADTVVIHRTRCYRDRHRSMRFLWDALRKGKMTIESITQVYLDFYLGCLDNRCDGCRRPIMRNVVQPFILQRAWDSCWTSADHEAWRVSGFLQEGFPGGTTSHRRLFAYQSHDPPGTSHWLALVFGRWWHGLRQTQDGSTDVLLRLPSI